MSNQQFVMSPKSGTFLACCLCLGMLPESRSAIAEEPTYGVVLFNATHQSIRQNVMNEGGKNHFSWPRGAYIENKYCAYRLLLSSEFVGAICFKYEYNWENSSPEIAESVKWFKATCAELVRPEKSNL